jgi:hypothetical protein
MKKEKADKLKVAAIMLVVTLLFLYSFYIHKNEPYFFHTEYVKVIE